MAYHNTGHGQRAFQAAVETASAGNVAQSDAQSLIVNMIEPSLDYFLHHLNRTWLLYQRSDAMLNELSGYFTAASNPYAALLHFLGNCKDFHLGKAKSLPYVGIEEFYKWIAGREETFKHCLNKDLKWAAFLLCVNQKNFILTKMIFEIFNLRCDGSLFVSHIKQLVSESRFKEACHLAAALGLQGHFGVEDFVVPLVFQDKHVLAEEFLANSPQHQRDLVVFLDTLLGKRNIKNEVDKIKINRKIPDVKSEKFFGKPLSKLIARLLKVHNLPMDLCPNLSRRRNEGALQFLINKRYVENSLGKESWREMVSEAVGNSPDMYQELVCAVNQAGDPEEALYWAHVYNVPKHHMPYNVRKLHDSPSTQSSQQSQVLPPSPYSEGEENWDTEVKFLEYPLPDDSIVVVDSKRSFEHLVEELRSVSIVGMDSEWKPAFGSKKNELALIQIATPQKVFILDIIALGASHEHLWRQFCDGLLENDGILKLGYNLVSDIAMFRSSLPHLDLIQISGVGYLDISLLWRKLVKYRGFQFPYPPEPGSGGESLSHVVLWCLGLPLDKSDQFSNWERRPLRDSQKKYAALDAYCLLMVYNALSEVSIKNRIPFSEICHDVMAKIKSPKKKPTKQLGKTPLSQEYETETADHEGPQLNPTPVSVHQIRVVCDTMVQGLGKQLRACGIDTVILDNSEEHEMCARIAQEQNRVILTRGNIFYQLEQHVPPGHCYAVSEDKVTDQLKEVLQYLNVIIRKEDVFSRCQLCNSSEFVEVSKSTMQQLATISEQLAKGLPQHMSLGVDEGDNDDMGGFWSEGEDDNEEAAACYSYSPWSGTGGESVDMRFCRTLKGARIQVAAVPPAIIENKSHFYICEMCGKCYWDGSHFERVLHSSLRGIVHS